MHVFKDSTLNTWKLITEKLPEKPKGFKIGYYVFPELDREMDNYYDTIAALKQNALTVGNPDEIFKYIKRPGLMDHFYQWPGTFEIVEVDDTGNSNCGDADVCGEVAVLILPTSQRYDMKTEPNTMENMTRDHHQKITETMNKETENPKTKSIIPYLLGEDSYDGYWWGQKHHDKRPEWWWRTKLREESQAKDAEIKYLRSIIALMSKTIKTE